MKNSKLKALMLRQNIALEQQKENQDDFLIINEESTFHLQGGNAAGPCIDQVESDGTCAGNTCGTYKSSCDCTDNGCKIY